MPPGRLSRRRFLGLAAGGAAVAAGVSVGALRLRDRPRAPVGPGGPVSQAGPGTTRVGRAGPWSDPETWGGAVPGEADLARVAGRVVLDTDARVGAVVVEPGATLAFHPARTLTLESLGNVHVQGRLQMRPGDPARVHALVFPAVEEAAFRGGGMDVLDSDVGLWATGPGRLDLRGSPKLPWTRLAGGVTAGAEVLDLVEEPAGWRPGDEVVVTPTLPPSRDHSLAYDVARVVSVSGRRVTLSGRLRFDHPAVAVGGTPRTAEVLNLTRNVRVAGTPSGRAHVWIRTSGPQDIGFAEVRHMGPRRPARDRRSPEGVLGRYPLHFHMAGDATAGSLVEGVVVRDSGFHAFVPHSSNGITFRRCVAHQVLDDAFWWDAGDATFGTLWDSCVASLVRFDPPFRGYRLAGFTLGAGQGNTVRGSVAVGVQGNVSAAGFSWPGNAGIWTFSDNLAHDNRVDGIFAWKNTPDVHVIERFTAYHNGKAGIEHGAYANPFRYLDSVVHGDGLAGVLLHAVSRDPGLTFEHVRVEGAGITQYGFLALPSPVEGGPALVVDSPVQGVTVAPFAVRGARESLRDRFSGRGAGYP